MAIFGEKIRRSSEKLENAVDIPSFQTRTFCTFILHYVYIRFGNYNLWYHTIFSISNTCIVYCRHKFSGNQNTHRDSSVSKINFSLILRFCSQYRPSTLRLLIHAEHVERIPTFSPVFTGCRLTHYFFFFLLSDNGRCLFLLISFFCVFFYFFR